MRPMLKNVCDVYETSELVKLNGPLTEKLIAELRRVTDFESHSQVKSGKVKSEVKSVGHCDLT